MNSELIFYFPDFVSGTKNEIGRKIKVEQLEIESLSYLICFVGIISSSKWKLIALN